MTNSWDWVERRRRLQRRSKRLSLIATIVSFGILCYIVDVSSIFKSPDNTEPAADTGASGLISQSVEPPESKLDEPNSEADRSARGPSSPTREHADSRTRPTPSSAAAEAVKSSETQDQVDAKIRDAINADVDRLQQPREPKSDETPTLPSVAESRYAELKASFENKKAHEVVSELLRPRENQGEPSLPTVAKSLLGEISVRQWLELAASEVDEASPETVGFAEAWLPIASAWSVVGEDAEVREAMRRVREAIPRMTRPERQIDIAMDLIDHDLCDRSFADQLFQSALESCEQIGDLHVRRTYYAPLSGIASRLGKNAISAKLFQQTVDPQTHQTGNHWVDRELLFIYRCRAAAWTEPPHVIEAIALELESLGGPNEEFFANCYARAAMAAARQTDRQQFYRTMFKAESAMSTERFRSQFTYIHAVPLGEAYLMARQWQNAVIIANNIPDPGLQASLLFRVLTHAPQHVPSFNLPDLFESHADRRWGARGVAGYVEHRLRSGDDALAVIGWIRRLPDPALRGAAYAGVARSSDVLRTSTESLPTSTVSVAKPDLNSPRSLIETAQQIANGMEDPIDSAYGWLEVAQACRFTGREQSYQDAVASFHDCCFAAWLEIWQKRPRAKKSYDNTYRDDYSRRQFAEGDEIIRLIDCERHLAEMQADQGDTDGAIYTCLRIADHAGFLEKSEWYVTWQYLFIQAIVMRIQHDTGVGPDVFLPRRFSVTTYSRSLVAAWTRNISQLQAEIERLRAESEPAELARASAELAILFARRGDVEGYRAARRLASSEIGQGRARQRIKCVLATADALAGEFELAQANLVAGEVPWFGGPGRARSQIAISLAQTGAWEPAMEQADMVSPRDAIYRSRALRAVAQARFKQDGFARITLLSWVDMFEAPNDKIAILCGIASAAEISPAQ